MMLPIIVGTAIGTLLHGFGTSTFGYYAPFMLFSSIIMPIAAGLITTFSVSTDFTKLILYTAFSGFVNGIGFSGPQTAVQTVLSAEDAPIGLYVMLFAQSFGPAVSVMSAQVLVKNMLSANLNGLVPALSSANIENNGLTEMIAKVPASKAEEALVGVAKSISQTWYLVVGLSCTTMIGSLLIEWRSVKQKKA